MTEGEEEEEEEEEEEAEHEDTRRASELQDYLQSKAAWSSSLPSNLISSSSPVAS